MKIYGCSILLHMLHQVCGTGSKDFSLLSFFLQAAKAHSLPKHTKEMVGGCIVTRLTNWPMWNSESQQKY